MWYIESFFKFILIFSEFLEISFHNLKKDHKKDLLK